jgi:hypothetical protein
MRAGSVLLAVAVLALLLVVNVSADAAAQREKIAKVSPAISPPPFFRGSASCPYLSAGSGDCMDNHTPFTADSQRGSSALS